VSQSSGRYPGDRTATGIVGIESVTYGVVDVATSTRFFEDFGLQLVEHGGSGATFVTPEQTTILIRGEGDDSLPAALEPGSTVREILWAVESDTALDVIAAKLESDRPVVRASSDTIHTIDPAGYGIGFQVTLRTPVRLEPIGINTIGDAIRRNERAKIYHRAKPQHIGHIVLYCPNYEEQLSFYVDRLGFMVSDTLRDTGAFLRCSSDHHNLFLLRHNRTGLNHVSFGVENIDEIMGGFDRLVKEGWKPSWGPGRHFIGSNLFYYFRNPAGGHVEYYADMDCIANPELWQAEEFDPNTPEALFAWGGYPPPDYRKSQHEIDEERERAEAASSEEQSS